MKTNTSPSSDPDDQGARAAASPANPATSHLASHELRLLQRSVRRAELRRLVPLADTTIYEMERRGEFPRRFNLTPRCVVWNLAEVEAWIAARRAASDANLLRRAPSPDVRQRKRRPIKAGPAS